MKKYEGPEKARHSEAFDGGENAKDVESQDLSPLFRLIKQLQKNRTKLPAVALCVGTPATNNSVNIGFSIPPFLELLSQ